MLIVDCIDCMGIWLLHVMLFSVEQDSPWRLVDCHTACMVVEQNFLLNLLDGRIACIQKYLTLSYTVIFC